MAFLINIINDMSKKPDLLSFKSKACETCSVILVNVS